MALAYRSSSNFSSASVTEDEAFQDFGFHLKATKAPKTVTFYGVQLKQLIHWADENGVSFDQFGKRHLDRFLAERSQNVGRTTLRHDAVAAKSFFRWCAKNDLVVRSPLAESEIHAAPRPPMYMPTEENIIALLKAVPAYCSLEKNPDVMKAIHQARRVLHRDRNYALLLMLLDTACRIGEVPNLKLDDYRAKERQIVIREAKGKEGRALPLSPATVEAVAVWLRSRAKMMNSVPSKQDEGWLFLSEYGGRMDESRFLKAVKSILRWANIDGDITLHSLRRYWLNRVAKTNLLAAQAIAGHKDPRTTLLYTKLDPDFLRDMHGEANVVAFWSRLAAGRHAAGTSEQSTRSRAIGFAPSYSLA